MSYPCIREGLGKSGKRKRGREGGRALSPSAPSLSLFLISPIPLCACYTGYTLGNGDFRGLSAGQPML